MRSRAFLVPAIAGVLAVLITAIGSWIPSMWGDEAASAMSAQRSLPSFLHEVTHVDAVHAVYYAGLHLWIDVFGNSAFSMRFPSAIATGLTVAGVIVLLRMFVSQWRLPLIAAALTLMLPRLDYVGIEVRGYSWTATLAVWIMIAAVATLTGRIGLRLGWSIFALLTGLGTALNLYVGTLILFVGVFAAYPRPRRAAQLRGWAIASLVGLALASPVIVFTVLERHQVSFLARSSIPASSWLVNQWFGDYFFAAIGWLLLIAAGVIIVVRRDRVDRTLGVVLMLWAGVPSAFLISTITTLHNYSPRYLAFAAPAVAMLIAITIEAVFRNWKPAGVMVLALALGATIPQYLYQRTPYAENGSDWAQVSALIAANAKPGDQLAFDAVVRPSRRPVSAFRIYPQDYRGLTAPQIVSPYWDQPTWLDKLVTIKTAAERGLFTAHTVFAVEANFPHEGILDVAGIPSLEEHGYRVVQQWSLHTDVVYRLERDDS